MINSILFRQTDNNSDHLPQCRVVVSEINKCSYLTVTGKYILLLYLDNVNIILTTLGITSSPATVVNKTATTITISWTLVPSDADEYVINVTSDTHNVTKKVK